MDNKFYVDVVLTSCGRFDLLKETINSFFMYLDENCKVESFILIDDSGKPEARDVIEGILAAFAQRTQLVVLINEVNIGQVASIDKAYAYVNQPYFFHLEDDWRFVRTGFMTRSLEVLEARTDIINLWLRAMHDTNGHPVPPDTIFEVAGRNYYELATGIKGCWYGFTWNPSLKRLSDYQLLAPFSAQRPLVKKKATGRYFMGEKDVSLYYGRMGFKGAIIADEAYVVHIGEDEHVRLPWEKLTLLQRLYWLFRRAFSFFQ